MIGMVTRFIDTLQYPNDEIADIKAKALPFCIIGASEYDSRVVGFKTALENAGWSSPKILTYYNIIKNCAKDIQALPKNTILRIDSPGRDFKLNKLLLRKGYPKALKMSSLYITPDELLHLEEDKGKISYQHQWYLGFCDILDSINNVLKTRPDIKLLQPIEDIKLMFDKTKTNRKLSEKNIATPEYYGLINGYNDLIDIIRDRKKGRLFIKSRFGSAASGVVAYQSNGKRQLAITTTEIKNNNGEYHFYNSRKLKRYESEKDIKSLIDHLSRDQIHVESWFPKKGVQGKICDCRVLIINKNVAHIVIRASDGPITNLHLGATRLDIKDLKSIIDESSWSAAMKTCIQVSYCFPHCFNLAVDLAFSPNGKKHAVLEVNAFGDLLKGVTYKGLTTYQLEVAALLDFIKTRNEYKAIFFDLDGTLINNTKFDIKDLKNDIGKIKEHYLLTLSEDEDILGILSKIKERYKLVIVSNGSGAIQRAKIKASGIENYFDKIIISGEEGSQKPRERIFKTALKAVNCASDEVLFVGNDPLCDIVGAKNLGMMTCWVGRLKDYPQGIVKPDYIIDSIYKLAGLII